MAQGDANDEAVFTVSELCKRWKCDRHTVLTAIKDGRLDAFRLGKRTFRIRASAVLQVENGPR